MATLEQLCAQVEGLTQQQRMIALSQAMVDVMAGLGKVDLPDTDPSEALSGFMLSSIMADGKIDDAEWQLLLPGFKVAFGEDFDVESLKTKLENDQELAETSKAYSEVMLVVINAFDEELRNKIILLCLLLTSVDGKISEHEKEYIKELLAC